MKEKQKRMNGTELKVWFLDYITNGSTIIQTGHFYVFLYLTLILICNLYRNDNDKLELKD